MTVGRLWILIPSASLLGCASPPGGFDSPVPSKRMDAAVGAAREGDMAAVPNLVAMLESDDPLVRLVAIRSLESLTGERFEYDHAAPEWQRARAVNRWADWARTQALSESGRLQDGSPEVSADRGAPRDQ